MEKIFLPIAEDIEEARSLLGKAEREPDPALKHVFLKQGIELLDVCSAEDLHTSECQLIANLRFAYTRRLLTQLPSLESVEMDLWLKYVILLFSTLEKEMSLAINNEHNLKKNLGDFLMLWGQEFLHAAEPSEEERSLFDPFVGNGKAGCA